MHYIGRRCDFFLFTSCRRVYWCVRDDSQLCLVCVHSLITRLQLTKMSVMYESAHVAITFQLLEISSITTHNQKQFRIFAQGTFFKVFLGKISAILPICIMKKKFNLEVTFKRYRFGYWNSCKRLPNFVNVAALVVSHRIGGHKKRLYSRQTKIKNR